MALPVTASTGRRANYDWDFTDETFTELRRLGIHPIADLCHLSMPDWAGDFQNPEWPELFGEYTGRLRCAVSTGAPLHAGQRDLRHCHVFRAIRLVE
jgi:hypothetical protein